MIVEFFKRGTGGSTGPIDYFLGKDKNREHAKILSGDLEEVAELIDSSPYVKKYTAGCLSFYEDDLSDANKEALMAEFEKTLFCGLTPEQYRIVWIEHKDKENAETGEKRLELNFLIPNIEITTGKRLQPFFAKADLQRVDDFKTIVNHEFKLFDPDDPINRRSVKIAKNLPQDKKDFIHEMNTEVALAITDGLVSDRESLKAWMTKIGLEITRTTKNHISVKNPNKPDGKPIVLKGEFYEQNFRHSEQSAELKRKASERYRQEADSRHANCLKRYRKLCESKSEYHLERYATRGRTNSAGLTKQLAKQENEYTGRHRQDGAELEKRHTGDAREFKDSNTELETGLADIKRIEPSDSRTSEAEKSPFFIEYSVSFDSTYFAYHQHLLRLRQQKQIQRHKRDAEESRVSEIERGEHEYQQLRQPVMYSNRHEQTELSGWIPNSEGGQLNDVRSTIIEDYRRSTASVEATTASTRRSSTAYTSTVSDHQRIEAIHANFKQQAQRSSEDRAEISANSARTVRANYLSNFFTRCTTELENTVADTFKRFSEELADREPGPQPNQARNTEFSASRDRATIEANGTTDEREVRLSEQLSRKISGFSTGNIITALDVLDQRRELQRAQERKNDRGYDSPSPF
ncbi:relaxase/mobilization nuclease domain-containing protein [Acinetobacter variabilis]